MVHSAEALGRELTDVENAESFCLAVTSPVTTCRARCGRAMRSWTRSWCYRTVAGPGLPAIVAAVRAVAVDVLLFASASAVRFVADALGGRWRVRRRSTILAGRCLPWTRSPPMRHAQQALAAWSCRMARRRTS